MRLPLHELTGQLLPMGALHPGLARRLREAVDLPAARAAVSRVLVEWIGAKNATQPHAISLPASVLLAEGLRVSDVARRLGCSERTLERHLLDDVGLSPKALQRVVRFRGYFAELQSGTPGPAAALKAGYYDQSHANRDFRTFTGTSPRAHFAEATALGRVFLDGDDPVA